MPLPSTKSKNYKKATKRSATTVGGLFIWINEHYSGMSKMKTLQFDGLLSHYKPLEKQIASFPRKIVVKESPPDFHEGFNTT